MAIFAKKQGDRRTSAKRSDEQPSELSGDEPPNAREAVDVRMDGGSEEQIARAPDRTETAADLPGNEQIVTAAAIEPVVGTPELVASGVVEPTVVESLDIEAEVIEPEAIEPAVETNGALAFGIGDAIRLMRSLPADPNIDLVVRVVRVTLGAVNVSVEDIMQDATKKEKEIQDSIATLQSEAGELEKQLYTKRCEIAAHEANLKEMVTVRERLHMADKYTGHRPPPTPPDAAKAAVNVPGHPRPSEWAAEWERTEQLKADLTRG